MLSKHITNLLSATHAVLAHLPPFFSFYTWLPRRVNILQVAVRPHQTTTEFPVLLPREGNEGFFGVVF
jgi:hypothetical protein